MAGLTKEQRAARAAEKAQAEKAAQQNTEAKEGGQPPAPPSPPAPKAKTVAMTRAEPMHTGGPTTADVHPAEVDNWTAAGWRVKE